MSSEKTPIARIVDIRVPKFGQKTISIIILCPHCGKRHTHGGGHLLTEISKFYGNRVAHCDGSKNYIIDQYTEEEAPKSYTPEYHRDYHRRYYHEKVKGKKSPSTNK